MAYYTLALKTQGFFKNSLYSLIPDGQMAPVRAETVKVEGRVAPHPSYTIVGLSWLSLSNSHSPPHMTSG